MGSVTINVSLGKLSQYKNSLMIMKKLVGIICVTVMGIVAFMFGHSTVTTNNIYPLTTWVKIVSEVEEDGDWVYLVTVEDATGNRWHYTSQTAGNRGDVVYLLMDSCGTKTIYDDVIKEVR